MEEKKQAQRGSEVPAAANREIRRRSTGGSTVRKQKTMEELLAAGKRLLAENAVEVAPKYSPAEVILSPFSQADNSAVLHPSAHAATITTQELDQPLSDSLVSTPTHDIYGTYCGHTLVMTTSLQNSVEMGQDNLRRYCVGLQDSLHELDADEFPKHLFAFTEESLRTTSHLSALKLWYNAEQGAYSAKYFQVGQYPLMVIVSPDLQKVDVLAKEVNGLRLEELTHERLDDMSSDLIHGILPDSYIIALSRQAAIKLVKSIRHHQEAAADDVLFQAHLNTAPEDKKEDDQQLCTFELAPLRSALQELDPRSTTPLSLANALRCKLDTINLAPEHSQRPTHRLSVLERKTPLSETVSIARVPDPILEILRTFITNPFENTHDLLQKIIAADFKSTDIRGLNAKLEQLCSENALAHYPDADDAATFYPLVGAESCLYHTLEKGQISFAKQNAALIIKRVLQIHTETLAITEAHGKDSPLTRKLKIVTKYLFNYTDNLYGGRNLNLYEIEIIFRWVKGNMRLNPISPGFFHSSYSNEWWKQGRLIQDRFCQLLMREVDELATGNKLDEARKLLNWAKDTEILGKHFSLCCLTNWGNPHHVSLINTKIAAIDTMQAQTEAHREIAPPAL